MGKFDFQQFSVLTPLESIGKAWYNFAFLQHDASLEALNLFQVFNKLSLTILPNECVLDYRRYCGEHGKDLFRDDFGLSRIHPEQLTQEYENFITFRQFYFDFPQLIYSKPQLADHSVGLDDFETVRLAYHDRYFPVTPHSHDFFELVILVRGHCKHMVGNDYLTMRTGDIVIIPPHTVHALFADDDDTVLFNLYVSAACFERSFVSLFSGKTVAGAFIRQTLYSRENISAYLLIQTGALFLGENLLADIYQELYSESSYRRDVLDLLCKLFFIRLLENYADSIRTTASIQASEGPLELLSYIRQKNGNVTLEELSDRFSYSSRQIARLITRYTGSSLSKLRKDLRLHQASRLLEQTALPVEEIAQRSGYQTPGHFYAEFKNTFGSTPLAYRKMLMDAQ